MKNTISLFLKILNKLDDQSELVEQLLEYIKQNNDNKIRITEFKKHFGFFKTETAEEVLNMLCELKILQKIENVYVCASCGTALDILTKWEEGDDKYCYKCNTIHPNANICDTETVYSLYTEPKLKVFTVNWLDKFEKDSNNNPLPRKAEIIAYTQMDAESIIHEYYHYIPGSINISAGIEIENKMLLKEYN